MAFHSFYVRVCRKNKIITLVKFGSHARMNMKGKSEKIVCQPMGMALRQTRKFSPSQATSDSKCLYLVLVLYQVPMELNIENWYHGLHVCIYCSSFGEMC